MNDSKTPAGGKVKKTRRRLRLSCVECTKRRQKCDRKYPCALCVSRGVSHLCRWETVPLARPLPARPPISSKHDQDKTVESLRARIAYLEKALDSRNNALQPIRTKLEAASDTLSFSSSSPSNTDITSPHTSPGPDISPRYPSSGLCIDDEKEPPIVPLFHLAPSAYARTSTLAQLALGHHGEYIGRGSLICTLYSISTGNTSRFLYANSTDSTCPYRGDLQGLSSNILLERVEALIQCIPPVSVTLSLMERFFSQSNWAFGIPEEWFRKAYSQMWDALGYPGPRGPRINANWLCLLFAILSYLQTPDSQGGGDCGDHYFMCSMTARRIAEDDYLNPPNVSLMVSAADGTVLGCLAIPILCNYLSQRGRVSEAWKIVGTGIRNAEAVGMHRDPEWKQWHVMSKDEVLLRRRAWWGLYICDKLYSYMLGRPQMLRQDIFDVLLPCPLESDGTRNSFNFAQNIFISLADLMGEVSDKCLSPMYPNCATFLDLDARLEHWEAQLPPEYRQHRDESITKNFDPIELATIDCRRYTLLSWYITVRIKLHIASMTGNGRSQQLRREILENRTRCVLLSMRLIRFQCETYDSITSHQAGSGPAFHQTTWFFEGCFSLFETTVAMITTLTRWPWKEKTAEADELVKRVIEVLTDVARQEVGKKGEIARMGAEVLRVLHRENWWRAQVSEGTVAPPSAFHGLPPGVYDTMKPCNGYEWFASATYSNMVQPQRPYAD